MKKLFPSLLLSASLSVYAGEGGGTELTPIESRVDSPWVQETFGHWAPNTKAYLVCEQVNYGWATTLFLDTGLPGSEETDLYYELSAGPDVSAFYDNQGPVVFIAADFGLLLKQMFVEDRELRARIVYNELDIDPWITLNPHPWFQAMKRLGNQGCRDPFILAALVSQGHGRFQAFLETNAVEANDRRKGIVLRIPHMVYKNRALTGKILLRYNRRWEVLELETK